MPFVTKRYHSDRWDADCSEQESYVLAQISGAYISLAALNSASSPWFSYLSSEFLFHKTNDFDPILQSLLFVLFLLLIKKTRVAPGLEKA